jgi:hypothetical protein
MKHRFFHAFKSESLIDAVVEALQQGHYVHIAGPDKQLMQALTNRRTFGEEKDLNLDGPITALGSDLYENDTVEDLIKVANTSDAPTLLVLIDHGNRTPNIATVLAKTEVKIISATFRRVELGEDKETGQLLREPYSDVDWLYGKPERPDFAKLTDEQNARFVRDGVKSLNDLIPVYEAEARGITLEDFLAMEIPKRAVLMSLAGVPLFFAESVNEMTARRNTGKTPLSLAWGFHIAAGESFLNFEITRKSVVAYIEGELPASQMQAWLRQQSHGLAIPPGGFNLLSRNLNAPNLTIDTEEGRSVIEGWLDQVKAEVAIFDSIKTLSTLSSISEETWGIWNQWFLRLRRKGICVIFLQHTGRGGDQYGSAMQEVALDVSIMLEPTNRNPGGAAFKMTFPKHREEGVLTPCHYQCSGAEWSVVEAPTVKTKPLSIEQQIIEMRNNGATYDQIEDQLHVSRKTISETIKKENSTHDVPSEATFQ